MDAMKRSYTEKLNTTRNFRYFDFLPGNFKLPRDRSLPNFCISWIKKFWQWQGIRCHFASIDFKQICHPFQQGNFFDCIWCVERRKGWVAGWSATMFRGGAPDQEVPGQYMSLMKGLLCTGPCFGRPPVIQFLGQRSDGETNIRLFSQTGRRRRPLIQKSLSG